MREQVGEAPADWPESAPLPRRDASVPLWLPHLLVLVVAGISGLLARRAAAAPTGEDFPDRLLPFVFATAVTGIGAFAPWWVLGAAGLGATGAAVLEGEAGLVALGLVAVLAAGLATAGERMGSTRRIELVPGAISAAATTQVALRLHEGFHGRPTVFAAVLLGALVLGAAADGPQPVRWLAGALGALAALGLVLGLTAAAVVGIQARTDADRGAERLRAGLDALQGGEPAAAEEAFQAASDELAKARDKLEAPWAGVTGWVPVLAQHRRAAFEALDAATSLSTTAGRAVGRLDLDILRLRQGRIDPVAVAELQAPLADLDNALALARTDLHLVRSPWLLWFVDDLLDNFDSRLADASDGTSKATLASQVVPDVLGGSGPRRYLVLFLNPATSRGLGGAVAGFASVVATDGALTVERAGSVNDLVAGVPPQGARISQPEYSALYERYADVQPSPPDGVVPGGFWYQLTRAPDLPTVAAAAAELYPQSGGATVDGVIVADPEGLAAVLQLTGPVAVPGLDHTLSADDAAEYLLVDQYAGDGGRLAALPAIAPAVVGALLATDLPPLDEAGQTLGPAFDEGRLGAWLSRPEEQRLLDLMGATAALPSSPGADLLAVTADNELGNAIDPYLTRASTYTVTLFPAADRATAELELKLTNVSPTEGVSSFAIANLVGEPAGTNRTTVTLRTPLTIDRAELAGQPVTPTTGTEAGRNVYSIPVTLPAKTDATLRVTLTGPLSKVTDVAGNYVLDVRPLPAATSDTLTVRVTAPTGVPLHVIDGPLGADDTGTLVFSGEPAEPFRMVVRAG